MEVFPDPACMVAVAITITKYRVFPVSGMFQVLCLHSNQALQQLDKLSPFYQWRNGGDGPLGDQLGAQATK